MANTLLNALALVGIACFSIGIVWLFFRLFVRQATSPADQKWKVPAAAAGFFAVFTALAGIYLPIRDDASRNVLIQETLYGSVEVDVDRLFIAPAGAELTLGSGFYVASDSSYYLQSPRGPDWRTEVRETPTFQSADRIQSTGFERVTGRVFSTMTEIPQLDDPRVERFCAVETTERIFELDSRTRVQGVTYRFNPLRDRSYWHYIGRVLPEVVEDILPDSLKSYADSLRATPWEIEQSITELERLGILGPPDEGSETVGISNSLCIAAFPRSAMRSRVREALKLPEHPLRLLGFANILSRVMGGFSLGSIQELEVSNDNRALLARSPIEITDVNVDGIRYPSLNLERIFLLAIGGHAAYLVQVQFIVLPGDDLSAWRQIHESLRSLRFIDD